MPFFTTCDMSPSGYMLVPGIEPLSLPDIQNGCLAMHGLPTDARLLSGLLPEIYSTHTVYYFFYSINITLLIRMDTTSQLYCIYMYLISNDITPTMIM